MEHRRNANYGRIECSGCLLDPEYDEEPILLGFNRVVAKGLMIADVEAKEVKDSEKEESKEESTTAAAASTNPTKKMKPRLVPYPCTVANRFECPYEKDKVKIDHLR
jgi:hypothetical protein